MELHGKICLITGGTSGIGAATALEFARAGCDIAIAGHKRPEEESEVKRQIESYGRRCYYELADLAEPELCKRWVASAVESLGGVDVLVHSAGTAVPGSLLEVCEDAWYRAFDLHIHAIFHLCRAAVPYMIPRRDGAIVLISSAAGSRGCAGAIAYGVVKGAVPQFTRAMARELAEHNIRVNCVSPGIIRTPFQDFLTPAQARNNVENRIPLHREGRPEDVAQAILMLARNEFITGENLAIDGGMTMRIA